MSYSTLLAMLSGKRPVWLYELTLGTEYALLTSHGSDYVEQEADLFDRTDFFSAADFFTKTWDSAPVKHQRIRVTSSVGRAEATLVLPQSHAFARKFLDDTGYLENSVTIYHLFSNDPDLEKATRYRGRVVSVEPGYTTIKLVCENRFTEFRRKALIAVMQRPCRHAHYHDPGAGLAGCKLDINDFLTAGSAINWTAPVLTVLAAAGQADGFYSGGVLVYGNTKQMITKHEGSSLTLLGPVRGLADAIASNGSADVSIAPGCPLTLAICDSRFNNSLNFGGFPWMTDSPYDGRSTF